jgi:hypothetical protein
MQSEKLWLFAWRLSPLLAGAGAGMLMRLAMDDEAPRPFGRVGQVMEFAFVYLVPFAVGALTAWLAERQRRRSLGRHFLAGAAANVLFVVGTLLLHIEGVICAVLILPLFALIGGVGAMAMASICRVAKRSGPPVAVVTVLPLLMAGLDLPLELPERVGEVVTERWVSAPPERIWPQLLDTPAIRADEIGAAWMYRIGVPLPLAATTTQVNGQWVRHVQMGKGIRFDQVAADWQPGRRLRWTYRFTDASFPPGALDDHVRIGGRHFDLLDTVYTLEPHGDQTLLRASMRYRVSTRFNGYAELLARWLIGDFEAAALRLYAGRAQAGRS